MARRITAEQLNRYSKSQLEQYIYRTAKKANLDLRALEKEGYAKGSAAYRYVKAKAVDDGMIGTNKKGEVYFKTRYPGASFYELKHIASEIQTFKESKTHTPAGVQRAYDKAYNTYLNKRAVHVAGEEEGTIAPSKAAVFKAKRELETKTDKNWFNQQWGALSKNSYKKASRASEQVAQLFEQGYSARQVTRALNKVGEEGTLEEYKNAMRKPKHSAYKQNYADELSTNKSSAFGSKKVVNPYIED